MADTIKEAYAMSKSVYDDTLTQAKWWSQLYIWLFWGGVDDREIANWVLERVPPDFYGRLLDVPVGTGVFTAQRYETLPHAEIICLDYSEDMLFQAKERFLRIENISCMHGDVGSLCFSDESFDMVLSMNGFHAFPHKEQAFFETARVLKKGGIFCGCFYIKGENRVTDLFVNAVLAKKGWFTPPFFSFSELQDILCSMYPFVEIYHQCSMVYFSCVK